MKKLISATAIGIGFGFSILVMILLVGVLINPEFLAIITPDEFVRHVICAAITGLGFSIPSLIYEKENMSRGLQVLIHLGIGCVIYIPTAFFAGWIPTMYGFISAAIYVLIGIVFALIIWSCFWLYHKKEADLMNKKISEKNLQS